MTVLRLPATLEKDHEHKGDQLMGRYGFTVIRLSQPRASMITPGVPDRRYYSTARGIAFWWEAKREDGKQSRAQRDFQKLCDATGDVYFCGTFDELAKWFALEVEVGFGTWRIAYGDAFRRLADAGVARRDRAVTTLG